MNLEKIKERLKKFENQGKVNTWKPESGISEIRIVPYIHNRDFPFLELYFYYDFGNTTIISPRSFGEPDPIYEFAQELKRKGDKESWKLGSQLEPKMRTYVPILVRGEEKDGVKFWGFGKKVYMELLRILDDSDYGDITDLKNGTDLKIEYSKNAGEEWPTTSIRPKRTPSPATTDPEIVAKLKEMPKVEDLWEVPTYEKLQSILENFLNNDTEESDTPAKDTTKYDRSKEKTPLESLEEDDDLGGLPDSFRTEKTKNLKDPIKTPASKSTFDDLFN